MTTCAHDWRYQDHATSDRAAARGLVVARCIRCGQRCYAGEPLAVLYPCACGLTLCLRPDQFLDCCRRAGVAN